MRLAVAVLLAHLHFTPARAQPPEDIVVIIHDRAEAHGINPLYLERVARCESTLNPYAVGALGEQGLFQLHPAGMGARFRREGYPDIWSVWQQADFTARMFAAGLSRHWSCS